jgi:hypothetical protein
MSIQQGLAGMVWGWWGTAAALGAGLTKRAGSRPEDGAQGRGNHAEFGATSITPSARRRYKRKCPRSFTPGPLTRLRLNCKCQVHAPLAMISGRSVAPYRPGSSLTTWTACLMSARYRSAAVFPNCRPLHRRISRRSSRAAGARTRRAARFLPTHTLAG